MPAEVTDSDIEVEDTEISLDADALEKAQQSFVVDTVSRLIAQAIKEGASDIHIEPHSKESILRYRIDGDLQDRDMPDKTWHNAIVSRIKIMAGMNIAERRLPQDGRFPLKLGSKSYELRVSMLPTVFNKESVVMRILDKSGISPRLLSKLGFSEENLARFETAIHKAHGLILVCGPIGSGKSTTLFAALNAINSPDTKILTVENPVEYNLPRILQVQTKEDIEPPLTFASALRASLRHDPDVIMVSEMRDAETARIGVQAALIGHLLFSTLHTNDTPSAITRLMNFEIHPFLIANAVLLVIAQRLPRAICKNCKVAVEPSDAEITILEDHSIDTTHLQFSRGEGCEACNGSGMRGRIAIHEVMETNDAIRQAILKEADGHEIKQVAMENGMKTLRQDGLAKAAQGLTTVVEIMRLTE